MFKMTIGKTEYTVRSHVIYPDGQIKEFCTLPEEERQRIARILNERALRTCGYVPVQE